MKPLYLILTVGAMLFATGCAKSTPDEVIRSARAAIVSDDYELAQRSLDAIDTDECSSPADLCEMAVIYMTISDNLPESGNDATALDCYRRAIAISPDSVNEYLSTLPADEAQYLFILASLNHGMEFRNDLPDEEAYTDDDSSADSGHPDSEIPERP